MSVSMVLLPVAIAVGMSLSSAAIAALDAVSQKGKHNLQPVETVFTDGAMLLKTLSEHGLEVKKLNENDYVINTAAGQLHYYLSKSTGAFLLEVRGVTDMDDLIDSVKALETEYGRNVQAFTYDKVMEHLAESGITAESEEVLEDGSVLLTLNV